MRVPKVLFSKTRGVFLGFLVTINERKERWSFLNSEEVDGTDLAPTFGSTDELAAYLTAALGQPTKSNAWCPDAKLIDCPTANGPGSTATSTNCKDSSIPGWD